jgi:hypothetical protein
MLQVLLNFFFFLISVYECVLELLHRPEFMK